MPKKIVVRGCRVLFERLPLDVELMTDILDDFRSAPDLTHVEMSYE